MKSHIFTMQLKDSFSGDKYEVWLEMTPYEPPDSPEIERCTVLNEEKEVVRDEEFVNQLIDFNWDTICNALAEIQAIG